MSDVVMPQMGESIVEGTITKWMKQVGETVERDEPLFEISTDKVDTEVPSPATGVLQKVFVEEGQTVEINTLVARIGDSRAESEDAGAAEAASPATAEPAPTGSAPAPPKETAAPDEAAAQEKTGVNGDDRVRSSPVVRRLAKEHGIDLSQVPGTGQGGRISKKDIEAYLKAREAAPAAPSSAASQAVPGGAIDPFRPAPEARFGKHKVESLSTMRRKIAEHMSLTMQLAPHVSTVHQIDCTAVAKLREGQKRTFSDDGTVKLTFMPFFLRAAAAALKEFPEVNASLDGDQIVYHDDVNIAVAVALEGGLIVPVIRAVDAKGIVGLQRAVNDLAARARSKQLKPDEVQQSTFSISNYGSFGSRFATPAINQPNSAILGLGTIHKAPVVVNDAIAIRSICYATLTFDHRLLDGAAADQFMTHLRGVIENWTEPIA